MERIINPNALKADIEDITLRPKSLKDFIGQRYLKENLEVFIQSSRLRGQYLEHILLSGPPGLGKTTIANIIASEMKSDIVNITGPALKKAEDVISILINLKPGDVFFIDEIHGLSKVVEEILYPAMEDFQLTFTRGKGGKNKNKTNTEIIKVRLKRFTLVGATTKIGYLTSPFRDRFGILLRFDLYTLDDLTEVIRRSSSMLNIPITSEGVAEIANRSRGTPRIANRLLRRVRDFAVVMNKKEIDKDVVDIALTSLRIDKLGLDDLDRRIIQDIYEHYNGGPVGIKTVAMGVGEEVRTIEDVYEPYLSHIGFLKRTERGREVTLEAIDHLEKLGVNFGINLKKKDKRKQKQDSKIKEEGDGRVLSLIDRDDMK